MLPALLPLPPACRLRGSLSSPGPALLANEGAGRATPEGLIQQPVTRGHHQAPQTSLSLPVGSLSFQKRQQGQSVPATKEQSHLNVT